ncbi:MAG: hypothetical protein MI739_11070 [Bacteroidales bacterium]|nr:hypothetical protein [Bacteroidales bacterium]
MNSKQVNPKLSGSYAVKPEVPVGITAIGMYVPPKELSNTDFANIRLSEEEEAFFGADPNFATNKRRFADGEKAMDMAVKAAKDALETYQIDPASIDLVLFTSSCKDLSRLAPPIANYVQTQIGAVNANSFNIDCGFNGWLPAVTTGASFIASGFYKKVLVVTGETIVGSMDNRDCKTLLMGDGAGAVVLEKVAEGDGLLSFHLMSSECESAAGFRVTGGCGFDNKWEIKPYMYIAPESFGRDLPALEQYVPHSVKESLNVISKTSQDVDCFVFGQQSFGLNYIWSKNLNVEYNKVHDTIAKHACMKCANIPVSLCDAVRNGRIKKGDIVAFGDQGANWSISSAVFKWCI